MMNELKMGNLSFKNPTRISSVQVKENSDVVRSIRIEAQDSHYQVSLRNGKLDRSYKYYNNPVSKLINGKKYDNIVSSLITADGTKTYETINRFYSVNYIVIKPNGEVIDGSVNKLGKYVTKFMKNTRRILGILI